MDKKEEKKIARTLLDIIDSEKNRIIREIFKLDEIESVKIRGLENYLYIPSETDDDEEDNDTNSSIGGAPTGQIITKGYSPTTEASPINESHFNHKLLMGNVLISGYDNIKPDSHGNVLTGKGTKKIENPHTSKHISAVKPKSRNIISEKGNQGSILIPISVHYRSFAKKEGNKVNHKIIITSPYDIDRGQIHLLVGGESSDSKIRIASSSIGTIEGNSISNLKLTEGKNELIVHFADNLQHSLKLEAYEIK